MKNQKGFTLIELLIVVAIIGIIAAIAIPNLLNALDRGKQTRTISDIRTIGIAMEQFNVDNGNFPTYTGSIDDSAFKAMLMPAYVKTLPENDGWDNLYEVDSSPTGYTLYSKGKGDAAEGCEEGTEVAGVFRTNTFSADICFMNGSFHQIPSGSQIP